MRARSRALRAEVIEQRNVAAARDHWVLGIIPLPWPIARAVAASLVLLVSAATLGMLHDERAWEPPLLCYAYWSIDDAWLMDVSWPTCGKG